MERCDLYRQFAAQCVELARHLDRPYDRTVLLEMALMWSRLAEHAAKYSVPKEPLEPRVAAWDHPMTSSSSWYSLARECHMRAAEMRARADEMKEIEPKAIMLRIAADYEKLAEWAENNSAPWWDKNLVSKRGSAVN